jgi:hydrogenase expression/formation protein HypE
MSRAGDSVQRVMLAHGGGGELMNRLIKDHLLEPLRNDTLAPLGDGAILPQPAGELVFTTDSYVVTPLEFPGGDIGRLAVAGTVNDVAVMGAIPTAISLGLILEEGLSLDVLDRIVASLAATAKEAGVPIVTGDTKVIERRRPMEAGGRAVAAVGAAGRGAVGVAVGTAPAYGVGAGGGVDPEIREGIFINTAGVGHMRPGARVDLSRVEAGDVVLVNGHLAEHGLAVMSVRNGIEFETELRSDAAPLNGLLEALFESGVDVRFLRDATRGGVAGVLADVASGAELSIEVEEAAIPLTPIARHAAEMLGLDPLATANEGKVVMVVPDGDRERALTALRDHPLGRNAACIGRLVDARPPLVELLTRTGGRRVVQRPYGEELPRIC